MYGGPEVSEETGAPIGVFVTGFDTFYCLCKYIFGHFAK